MKPKTFIPKKNPEKYIKKLLEEQTQNNPVDWGTLLTLYASCDEYVEEQKKFCDFRQKHSVGSEIARRIKYGKAYQISHLSCSITKMVGGGNIIIC